MARNCSVIDRPQLHLQWVVLKHQQKQLGIQMSTKVFLWTPGLLIIGAGDAIVVADDLTTIHPPG
jgi:hypothetical protein